MEKKQKQKNAVLKSAAVRGQERKFWRLAAVSTAVVLLIAIFATLLAYTLPGTYDMTSSRIFTLTEGTDDVLAGLTKPVKIGAVYATGKEETMVKALLGEYEQASDLITVEYLDAQKSPALLSGYNLGDAQTVSNGTLIFNCGDRVKLLNDDDMYTYGTNGNIFYGEQDITGAIRYVTTDDLPVVYLTTGHGETAESDLSQAEALLNNEAYEVKPLVMLEDDIPADADIVVMASPTSDINDYEKGLLDAYLQNGGRFLLLADPFLTTDFDALPNLNAVTSEFGVDITNNYVVEGNGSYHLTSSALYLIPRYGDHEIVNTLSEDQKLLILPIVRGLSDVDYDQNTVSLTPLLASSADSWARTDMSSQSESQIASDVQGPIILAFAAERSSGKTGVDSARVVVVGDGSFVVGDNVSAQGNGDFFLSCVDWLRGAGTTVAVPGKVINASTMLIRGSDFTKLAVICCAVVPLILFLGAVLIGRAQKNK